MITGGDTGDVRGNLAFAVREITRSVGRIVRKSRVCESSAWGFESPRLFANQVLVVETSLAPRAVLEALWKIEAAKGKDFHRYFDGRGRKIKSEKTKPGIVYASRALDIDILFYDDLVMDDDYLTLPHPLIPVRRFVLEPLYEVMPHYIHPLLHKSVGELYASSV